MKLCAHNWLMPSLWSINQSMNNCKAKLTAPYHRGGVRQHYPIPWEWGQTVLPHTIGAGSDSTASYHRGGVRHTATCHGGEVRQYCPIPWGWGQTVLPYTMGVGSDSTAPCKHEHFIKKYLLHSIQLLHQTRPIVLECTHDYRAKMPSQ